MDRYQVREYDGPGAKFGVYDTKDKKFVQKGSKYVMNAACKDLNTKQTELVEEKVTPIITVDDITKYITISDDREQWDYPMQDIDEAKLNNDYLVINKSDNRIYEVTEEEWDIIVDKTKKTEVQERDLSKDLFSGEAQTRTINKLMFLDTYLTKLQQAIDSKDEQGIEDNKAKALYDIGYLIPALNIVGGVKGLIKYLQTTDFEFTNKFKDNTEALEMVGNEYKKLYEEKQLRRYNSRLYGVYDTEENKYVDTGSLEEMKEEVEAEKEVKEEPQEQEIVDDNKKGIDINISIKGENFEADLEQAKEDSKEKGLYSESKEMEEKRKLTFGEYMDIFDPGCNLSEEELRQMYELDKDAEYTEEEIEAMRQEMAEEDLEESKEIKTESTEEDIKIINIDDKPYKSGLYKVSLYPGAGAELVPYYVYANYEQDALEILIPYLEENAPGLLIDIEDLEDEDLDNYISIDGIHYLDYNTQIEEINEEE